jgi:hypothetical protein
MAQPPDDPVDRRIRVAVFGSCMTRDNFNRRFNAGYATWYRVVGMQVQASVISLMSRPTPVDEGALERLRPYEARKVRGDFTKVFLDDLAVLQPDYLVVDFSGDIRFGVIRCEADRWVTGYRRVLRQVGWYQELAAAGPVTDLRVARDGEAYLAPWTAAADRFAGHVRSVTPRTIVVLHRGHHTRLLRLAGSSRTVSLMEHRRVARLDLDRIDALWSRMDDHAVEAHGWHAIDLRGREYPTSDSHPWGAGYLHYSPDYYADFLAALNALHLDRTTEAADPERQAMVGFIASRAAEPAPGRSWDLEPGRGSVAPQIRTSRRRFGRIRRTAGRARRRIAATLRAERRQPLDPAA